MMYKVGQREIEVTEKSYLTAKREKIVVRVPTDSGMANGPAKAILDDVSPSVGAVIAITSVLVVVFAQAIENVWLSTGLVVATILFAIWVSRAMLAQASETIDWIGVTPAEHAELAKKLDENTRDRTKRMILPELEQLAREA